MIALLCWAISTFVASPAFFGWTWQSITVDSRAADYLRLCHDPFARDLNEPILAYRIVAPLVAWTLHLSTIPALVLPYLAHLGFLGVVFCALRRRAAVTTALLGTLTVALSFALFWSNWRPGFTDTVTHLCTAAMLLSPAAVPSGILCLLGLCNDERMVLTLPFVLLWQFPLKPTAGWLKESWRWLAAIGTALFVYGVLRHALTAGWIGPGISRPQVYTGIKTQLAGLKPHLGSWTVWLLNVFLAFRWGWLLLLPYLKILGRGGERLTLLLYTSALGLGVLSSAVVADVARSVGFLFPALLIAISRAGKDNETVLVHRLFSTVVALLVTPVFFTFENFHVQWFRPLPLVLWRCFHPPG